MGYKLIILLGLLLGVLYCIHILVQDYQAVTAVPKLLRLLFKRDISSHVYKKPSVRWRKILMYDRIQCTRFFYCTLGVEPRDEEPRKGFILMLSLDPQSEDRSSLEEFKKAFEYGQNCKEETCCRRQFPLCPFNSSLLFDLIKYLLYNEHSSK